MQNKLAKEKAKKTSRPKKEKNPRKLTNKEKAQFSEQNRVDMYPVDPYND
ncbi:MAG: hypothetical protein K5879_11665 [Lachnospiraceae bacterium]|nr:hypothetical protein [Lachnospiraceae bacterium]